MPFGKFKGYEVTTLPRVYLEWLASIELREPLRTAVGREMHNRAGEALTRTTDPADVRSMAAEIVSAGYRTLALKYHPDHGGTHADMTKLNAARDWLREQT